MSEELKPCPFCGAKASVQRYSSGTGGPKCAVWCDACHVGTSWLHGDDGEARVVAEWNRRTPVAARELDVEAERRKFAAVRAVVGAIYFDDSSDFKSALWEVVRHLAPELVEELESNPSGAWHTTEHLVLEAAARSAAQGTQAKREASTKSAKPLRDEAKDAVVDAARKLVQCKGRYHTEQNFRALADAVAAHTKGGVNV